MSLDAIEKLKREWTDQYVVVDDSVPELRRFAGLTGRVKTVNMNGHALVEFSSRCSPPYPDISWYDISPLYLQVVDKPVEQPAQEQKPAAEEKKAAAKTDKAASSPAGPKSKKSPLELAREQDAGRSAAPTAGAESSGKKPSPLERARQQDAGGKPDSTPEAGQSRTGTEDGAAPSGKKPSPLELARQQGAAKRGEDSQSGRDSEAVSTASPATAEQTKETEEEGEAHSGQQPASNKSETPTGPGGRPLSKLELARMQGPAKRNE